MKTLEKGRSDLAEIGEGGFQAEETESEEGTTSDKSLGDGHVLVCDWSGGNLGEGKETSREVLGTQTTQVLKGYSEDLDFYWG